jgi:2'-5' RNA ligase
MPNPAGIFVIVELSGVLARQVSTIQRANDPRLAALWPPHVTLIGSSGAGPIHADTPIDQLRAQLSAVASGTEPMTLEFSAPYRFADRDIVVLPLDPHGPLRALHERLMRCGARMHRARYPFTPHCTLTMYTPLARARERRLTAVRAAEPLFVDRLRVLLTCDPQPAKLLFELPLGTISADASRHPGDAG